MSLWLLMKTAACCFSWLKSWFYGHCHCFFVGSGSLQVGSDRQINIHALCTTLMHQHNVFCRDAVQERNRNMRNNRSNSHRRHARTRAHSQAGTYRRFLVSGDPRVQNQWFFFFFAPTQPQNSKLTLKLLVIIFLKHKKECLASWTDGHVTWFHKQQTGCLVPQHKQWKRRHRQQATYLKLLAMN